jgi:hypothetical protein
MGKGMSNLTLRLLSATGPRLSPLSARDALVLSDDDISALIGSCCVETFAGPCPCFLVFRTCGSPSRENVSVVAPAPRS